MLKRQHSSINSPWFSTLMRLSNIVGSNSSCFNNTAALSSVAWKLKPLAGFYKIFRFWNGWNITIIVGEVVSLLALIHQYLGISIFTLSRYARCGIPACFWGPFQKPDWYFRVASGIVCQCQILDYCHRYIPQNLLKVVLNVCFNWYSKLNSAPIFFLFLIALMFGPQKHL
jgi:hypothetical protein